MKTLMMLLLAGMFAVGCDRKQSPAPVKAQAKFHSSEGRFSADFPGEPTHKFQLSPRGGHPVHAYTTKVSGQLAFTITYEDFPPADVQNPEFALQQSVRDSAYIQKALVKKETALNHDGYPARAYELDCGSLLLQGRYILAGSRRYHVAALISKKILAQREQEVTRFIESFEVSK